MIILKINLHILPYLSKVSNSFPQTENAENIQILSGPNYDYV